MVENDILCNSIVRFCIGRNVSNWENMHDDWSKITSTTPNGIAVKAVELSLFMGAFCDYVLMQICRINLTSFLGNNILAEE